MIWLVESETESFYGILFVLGVRMKSRQKCLTTHCTVQWENPMVAARTKTTTRKTISHPQKCLHVPLNQQMETLIAHRCPPHATAPSPAQRLNLSLQSPLHCILYHRRNRWCPLAQKEGWPKTDLLCLLSPDQAFQNLRPLNPETTERAPSCPANSGCRQDLASHSLKKTVSEKYS